MNIIDKAIKHCDMNKLKYRQRANLFFGWWLMIPLALIIMIRYRIDYFDKYKPRLAKQFTRTFGLAVNWPSRSK